jgi:hypothetical protein
VVGMGVYLLINRRHPRFLARIRPTQLALWSFAVAMAHGAGLMLVPIFLGLCRAEELDAGHTAAMNLMGGNVGMAVAVSVVHAAAMIVSGGASRGRCSSGWARSSSRKAGSTWTWCGPSA